VTLVESGLRPCYLLEVPIQPQRLQRPGVWGSPQSSFALGIPTKPPGSLQPDIGKVAHPLGWRRAPYQAAPKGFYVPGKLTPRQPEPRRDGYCRAAHPSLAAGSTQCEQASAPGVDPASMGDGCHYGTMGRGHRQCWEHQNGARQARS